MAKTDSLKRLGGGRWETRDGRFQIEPQSGTWVIVDTTQANEFGLPLVRGPFPSLTAAKEAIETAREEGPVTSPLAERMGEAGKAEPERKTASAVRRAGNADTDAADVEGDEPEPEPQWLRNLKPLSRQRARDLVEKLESLGFDDADAIARSEIADGEPAVVRAAIRRQIEQATKGNRSVDSAVEAVLEVLVSGEDDDLDVGWGLVDQRSRPIERLDLAD